MDVHKPWFKALGDGDFMCMLCMKHVTEEHLVTDTSGGKLILRGMATRWLKSVPSKG